MPKRLLILMDDEPVTCRTLALDLTDAGYDVETAADSEDALEKLRLGTFDLLIAGEGEASGGRVVEGYCASQPSAKVVLMTTDGTQVSGVDRLECRTLVRKPFDLEEFRTVVQRLLDPESSTKGKAM